MNRAEALTLAREHVEAMATNKRGYQDGVKLAEKVAAVETFARFLLGDGEPVIDITSMADAEPVKMRAPSWWADLSEGEA